MAELGGQQRWRHPLNGGRNLLLQRGHILVGFQGVSILASEHKGGRQESAHQLVQALLGEAAVDDDQVRKQCQQRLPDLLHMMEGKGSAQACGESMRGQDEGEVARVQCSSHYGFE